MPPRFLPPHPACLPPAVGNFSDGEAAELLGALRAAAGERSQLLLCTDMWKEEGALLAAYNDPQGAGPLERCRHLFVGAARGRCILQLPCPSSRPGAQAR